MSVINKVLRDLDRRQAPIAGGEPAATPLKVITAKRDGHEWFWRTVACLVLAALGWIAWVVYQVQPRPIATELAHAAAEKAPTPTPAPVAQAPAQPPAAPTVTVPKPAAEAAVTTPTPPPAPSPAAKPEPQEPVAVKAKPPVAVDPLRFAYSIETPIGAPAPKAEPKPEAKKKPVPEKSRVERRDVALTPAEKADTEFRRGVDLLKRGRATEAEAAFRSALAADTRNRGARQALVALKMERGDLEDASRLLRETLAIDPGQPEFAVALARIHVERARLLDALAVLDAASASEAGANFGELHVLRGGVLQRLGRHPEAAEAYRIALRAQSGTPQAWLGLGISLEALSRRPEAAQAFRNALVAGPVSAEVRTFAEERIRALR